ncbi:hypothetical protein LCGC14_0898720 [marine sediment metagenome]|uniref:Uncharacterized protein n=1 Tax=marine sediment metagenome TaxID=412755 RepID=A0A0F9S3X3_9ZZZZ
MEAQLDKTRLPNIESSPNAQELERATRTAHIVALIEIREAIQEGFEKLDQTHIEAAMMVAAYKESFDTFLTTRIRSDKVLSDVLAKVQGHPIAGKKQATDNLDKIDEALENPVAAANSGKAPEKAEKPDTTPAEENKSSVTLKDGGFGKVPSDSGIG